MKTRNILMIIFGVIALAINTYIVVEACTGVESSSATSHGFSQAIIDFITSINPSSHIGDDPEKVHAVVRKLFGHFLLFGASGTFTTLSFMMLEDVMVNKKLQVTLSCLGFGLGIAILSELIQIFTPGRYGLVSDMAIDFAGFAFAFAIIFLIVYLISHKKKGIKE